jgi:hypothetical protein
MLSSRPIYRFVLCMVGAGIVCLAGCAKLSDIGWGVLTSKVDAFAIVNQQLLVGSVYLVPDRTGRVVLGPHPESGQVCAGGMHYTGMNSGIVDLHCGEGSDGQLEFNLVSDARGYAYGMVGSDRVSLVFGMPAHDAPAYLRAPVGRKFVVNEAENHLSMK